MAMIGVFLLCLAGMLGNLKQHMMQVGPVRRLTHGIIDCASLLLTLSWTACL
jgi:hypothetical protein